MSVQPTPRSLAGSGSLDASNVAELAGRVFEVLANGQETIGIQAGYGVFLWMFTRSASKPAPMENLTANLSGKMNMQQQ